MSGKRVTFIGDAMAAVVQGVAEVRALIGQPPVVVGDALRWIRDTGGTDLTLDDLDLIAELLLSACERG